MTPDSLALTLALSDHPFRADRPLYPVALATDGEWLAYRPGSPHGAPADGCLLESLLPEIRQLALHMALRRGLPAGDTPARIAEPADWLAARLLLLEWKQLAVGLADLALLDEANRRAASFAEAAGWTREATLPVLSAQGRAPGLLQGWSETAMPEHGIIEGSQAFRRIVAARFAALFAR
ncbi:hypothetical protein [Chromobacterium sp. IIBBL 290-4]|uniref:hypothetical protein n=1 Tax=Chromobacterium sp. IIBBL 290-4 TaxID=2953890 RepID=UPI0020B7873C|nr:hypothetical protein [Chromobacterium sp. IIBBL 290-4]UTH76669.1 hypothetical protein NKT35_11460 [Chromobacterium sp. IIBBL 290-4]